LAGRATVATVVMSEEELKRERLLERAQIRLPDDRFQKSALMIKATVPIYSELEELIGVVIAGCLVNNNLTITEGMEETVDFAIYQQDSAVLTNMTDRQEKSILGEAIDPKVKNEVLTGEAFSTRAVIGRRRYIVSYTPIKDIEARPIGTIAAAIGIEAISEMNRYTIGIMLLITVGGLFLAVILSIFISRGIIGPLNQVVNMLRDIAKGGGDLTKKLAVLTKDELGELARWFNVFIGTIHNIVSQVRITSEKVTSSSQNLSTTAQEMNASTVEISNTIQRVSKGVSDQAAKIETTSRIMEELSTSVKQVSSNAQAAASSSEQASKTAQEGGKLAHQAVERMARINEVIGSSADMVKRLASRSRQIFEIVDVLTSIADQTNLLALNAAIEAARAGEAGRGFAVVAEEVRKLAEGSAKSAKDIARLVQEIQTETTEAATSMEQGTKEISQGTKIVNEVGSALSKIVKAAQEASQMVNQIASSKIVKAAQEASQMVNQIASASIQQLEGTKKVATSVNEIAAIAEESASGAQQATSSTQEQTASMEEMASYPGWPAA